MCGIDVVMYLFDWLGMSVFVCEDGVIYYMYLIYVCGFDGLWGMY